MVSHFIEKKVVKDYFKKYFPKPKFKSNPIIEVQKSVNPSNVGFAFELYTLCYYDFIFNKDRKSINSNAFMLEVKDFLLKCQAEKYNEYNVSFQGAYSYSLTKLMKDDAVRKDVLKNDSLFRKEKYILNHYLPKLKISSDTIKKIYEIEKAETKILNFVKEYRKYLENGIINDDFLFKLMSLQNFNHPMFLSFLKTEGIKNDVNEIDLTILKELIKKFPSDFFGKELKNKIKTQKALMSGFINGRPDFIHNNKIIEIKTTKTFFRQEDYHQILCYFFLYMHDQAILNVTNYTKEDFLQECDIRELEIYYSYYYQSIKINVENLYEIPDFKKAYDEFRELTEDYF